MLRKQLLITSLSDSDYTETEYSMGGNVHRSKFPPVALATMLQLRGWHALVFASKGAGHEHYADLQKEFECAGLTAEFIEISVARSQSDHMSILDLMTDQICDNSEVILDITYSQGHLPFIYLAALSYLVGLRAVQLSGIYHGVTVGAGLAELIEITALFELTQWYHAIATAKQSGDHRPLVTLMEKQRRELFRHKIESAEVSNTVSSMKSLSEALASGLPVEIGIYSARVSQALMNMEKSTVPTSITLKFARERFRKVVDQWAIANDLHKMQKKDVRLDWNELSRQLHLTEWFLQKQQQPTVAMLLREWFVSLVLHLRAESADDWLTHGTRASAEKLLNSLETACRKNLLKPDLSKLVSNWSSVSQLRNKLAHAGMTLDKVITSSEKFVAIIEDCKLLLSNCEQLALLIQEYESSAVQVGTTNVVARKWLVSGVGDSPGALYTALIALKPDRVIVVASSDSDINIPAVLVLSGMEPDNVSIKHMKDPFYGFNELDTLFTTQDWLELEGASELVVNITGGTTAMQYVIHKIAQRLETHGVRIVAALDQHGAQEQHSNPLIAGELVEVSNSTRMAAAERQEMDHHNCQ